MRIDLNFRYDVKRRNNNAGRAQEFIGKVVLFSGMAVKLLILLMAVEPWHPVL